MAGLKLFKNLPITTKFIFWFLIIALIPLTIATYISYNRSREVLRQEVSNSLIASAENKANQIEVYLNKKEEDLTRLSHMSDVIYAIEKFDKAYDAGGFDSSEYSAVDNEFRPFFTYYQKSSGYDDLFLIRPYGDVLFSVKGKVVRSIYEARPRRYAQLKELFFKVNTSLKTEVSDFEYDSNLGEGHVFIAAPIFKAGEISGLVVAQLGNRGISELVQDYSGLGNTGETVVAAKIDDAAVVIAPLRFDPEAAFRRKIAIGSKEASDIQKAVQGQKGSGILIDYRGKQVLSVWRYIPNFRWGIVVKMDTSEVFASADRLRSVLLIVSFILLIFVVITAILIAHSVSSPIKELTKVSGNIADGDLSARAKITTTDEIGQLAESFNKMTDKLVEAKANVEQKNEELEEQKKLLEKANKELDSFVYTASHDLRAPLRGISSFASFLEEDYQDKLDEEGKNFLRQIRDGTNRMNNLIEDLLKLSRISRIKNPYEDVDMNSLINSVIKRIEFDIKENNVELNIQPDIPRVRCDRIKMTEVFLNLINNAIKFSSKNNKVRPRIEVGYSDEGQFHKFYVKDNGIGIDPKYHKQVFGMFKRLHTDKEYEGTGAGLGIVKRVIDDHGGNIWVESELGKGAIFYFTIPKELQKKRKGETLAESDLIAK
jgi:signal transduction histidine kinase